MRHHASPPRDALFHQYRKGHTSEYLLYMLDRMIEDIYHVSAWSGIRYEGNDERVPEMVNIQKDMMKTHPVLA